MYEKKFVLEINTEKSNEAHIWLNFLTAAKIHHKHHVMLMISIRCAFVGSSRIVQNKAAVRSSTARLHGFALDLLSSRPFSPSKRSPETCRLACLPWWQMAAIVYLLRSEVGEAVADARVQCYPRVAGTSEFLSLSGPVWNRWTLLASLPIGTYLAPKVTRR